MNDRNPKAEEALFDDLLKDEVAAALAASRQAGLGELRRRRWSRNLTLVLAVAAALLLAIGIQWQTRTKPQEPQIASIAGIAKPQVKTPVSSKLVNPVMNMVRIERQGFLVPVKITSTSELVSCKQLSRAHGVRPRVMPLPGSKLPKKSHS
ncbi:MAG: hypothetical protein RL095_338 [Verrucomicrobiota bacterium]|jgi:hypothetical protein